MAEQQPGEQEGSGNEVRQATNDSVAVGSINVEGNIQGINVRNVSSEQPPDRAVFISYARPDIEFVTKLKDDLSEAGHSVWFDVQDLKAGHTWRVQIARAIDTCKAFILVISPNSVRSDNVRREVNLAQDSGKTILPVIYRAAEIPAELGYPLAGPQLINMEGDKYSEGFKALSEALKHEAVRETENRSGDVGGFVTNSASGSSTARSGAMGSGTANRVRQQNPYIGPRTFLREEAHLFFGREREARELLTFVESEQPMIFYAQSGAGKSSLINTRLIPELEENRFEVLPVTRVSGEAPNGITLKNIYAYNLMYNMMRREANPDSLAELTLTDFMGRLNEDEQGYFYDASLAAPLRGNPEVKSSMRALIIDQFEELFSTHAESWEKREDFFRQLAQALQDDPQLCVMLVMREDYVASLDPYVQLVRNGLRTRNSMQRLSREAALEAVKRPAEMMSRPYAPGVAEKLVEELSAIKVPRPDGTFEVRPGQYVEPVQLQTVCYSLWENLPAGGTQITDRDVQDLGDVNQVLGRYYDRRVHEVAVRMNVKESWIRDWFRTKLISPSGIRTLVLQEREKNSGLDDKVIQALQSDLLVRAENRGGAIWYELTHDRLVEPILESNRRWFDEQASPFQRQATLWANQAYSQSFLLRDQALVEAEAWAKEFPDKLTDAEIEFLKASRELQPLSEEAAAETDTEVAEESEAERAIRLQAAIAANLLANNRSQAVFNDKPQGEDQLGIKNEVEALAETLLLRDVEPPVAVGVMGGWGSGKSFVMYLIDQYVQSIRAQRVKKGWADSDEKDPKIPVFVGHIYQIHFNAWTYAKSNLWASLMDTIFSCLNRQMQLERLLAHREFSPDKPPTKEQIHASMLAGGNEFKKIYLDNPQLGQDKDLEQWRKNLEHWGQYLLKGTLLWNIMRGQQVETLEKLKDTEEQLNQLKARREQFEKERPLDEITAKDLDPTARKAYLQSIKSFMLAFLSDQLSTVAKNELKKQDVKEEDVQKYLEEAKGLWGGLKTVITAFRRSKLYVIWTLIFFALTFALPSVWEEYDLEFVQLQAAKLITWVLTFLPTLAVILPWVKKSIEASVESKKILEGAYVAQQAKHADEIANATDKPLPQKISELQADISRGSVAAYDALIGLLEAQAAEQRQKIGPSAKYSNLMEFVQSRLDAATYENQLGLMHQVRQDIDELTFSLVDNTSPDVFPRGKPRVILYIDDLDRCPPPRVVEMLEAVQLLLNTKLFIVILGLDTRYVTRALEKEYKEILQHEGDPSGLDYIEKIIQIPYRVRAIEKDNLRLYIEKQMDIEKAQEPEPATSSPPVQTAVVRDAQPVPEQSEQNSPVLDQQEEQPIEQQSIQEQSAQDQPSAELKTPSQTAESAQSPAIDRQPEEEPQPVSQSISQQPVSPPPVETKAPEPPTPLEIDLPAAVIQFKQEDLEDLAVCCQKIMLTPRSIKRLVNVFKLMKIFWFRADKDAGIAERDRPRAVKQAAMSLLALSSAYPEVMREVFVHLDVLYRQGQEKTELFTALNNIKLPPGSANELSWQLQKYKADVSALKAIVGNGQDKFGQLVLQDLKLSTFNIVRSFSFVGDPVYWTEDEADQISSSNGDKPQPIKAKRNKNGK
jgi:hypothetical protein